MKIDWTNFLEPRKRVKRVRSYLYRLIFNTNAPLHMSNHYNRENFEPGKQDKLF